MLCTECMIVFTTSHHNCVWCWEWISLHSNALNVSNMLQLKLVVLYLYLQQTPSRYHSFRTGEATWMSSETSSRNSSCPSFSFFSYYSCSYFTVEVLVKCSSLTKWQFLQTKQDKTTLLCFKYSQQPYKTTLFESERKILQGICKTCRHYQLHVQYLWFLISVLINTETGSQTLFSN